MSNANRALHLNWSLDLDLKMPPRHISSGTIPKSSSRPPSRHTRSRGPPQDSAIEDIPEPPAVAQQSEAPQEPAPSQQEVASSHPGNEDVLEAAAKTCTEISAPFAGCVINLQKAIPSLLVTNEDAFARLAAIEALLENCLLYTSPSPRDQRGSRMPSSA